MTGAAPASGLSEKLREGLLLHEIPTLNGLRAIAVILVILGHAGLPAPGGFGVLTFFTLSGFLITWLLLSEHRQTGGISLKTFYARRTLRIFPAYYVYAAVLVGLLAATHRPLNVPQALASLFYVNDYYQAIHGDPNTGFSQTWSLAVEEQFYLLWAPAIILLLHYKKIFPALVTAIAAIWIYRIVLVAMHVDQGYIYEAFDTRADHLLIGCLLAWLLFEGKWLSLLKWACRARTAVLLALLLAALNLAELRWGTRFRDLVSFSFEPALLALLLPGVIQAKGSLVYRFLQSRAMSGIGRLSYSMYLYQQLVVSPVVKRLGALPSIVRAVATVSATLAVALCSYHLVEKPFLRMKARLGQGRRREARAPLPPLGEEA